MAGSVGPTEPPNGELEEGNEENRGERWLDPVEPSKLPAELRWV